MANMLAIFQEHSPAVTRHTSARNVLWVSMPRKLGSVSAQIARLDSRATSNEQGVSRVQRALCRSKRATHARRVSRDRLLQSAQKAILNARAAIPRRSTLNMYNICVQIRIYRHV